MLREAVKRWWNYQWSDMSGVIPEQRLVYERGKPVFHLNSEAGTICYKPKTNEQLCRFRDDALNRFMLLKERHARGEKVSKELFVLYRDIRKRYRPRSKTTLATRLRAVGVAVLTTACATTTPPSKLESRMKKIEDEMSSLRVAVSELVTDKAIRDATPKDDPYACPPEVDCD